MLPEHSGGRDVSEQHRPTLVGSHVEDDVRLVLRIESVQCSVVDVQFRCEGCEEKERKNNKY